MRIPAPHLDTLSAEDRRRLESLLLSFDQNWDERQLQARLRELPTDSPLRRPALLEMIKIDLERRWRQGKKALVESYCKALPELGEAGSAPLDLILAEHEARRQVGAAPESGEYRKRFPGRDAEIREGLDRLTRSVPLETSPSTPHTEAVSTPRGKPAAPGKPAPPAGEPVLSEQFGRYRILKKLGKGGMGTVYLAHDAQLDRRVALKVPHFSAEDGPEVRERFLREARATATIDHPNVCRVYDVGEIDGVPYVTMAYVEGKPLSDLLTDGKPLPQRAVAALTRKLALALAEAHKHGVIHRDLKPANVMVNAKKEPVVMDFGLARRLNKGDEQLTRSGAVLGTPAYMSPEQVRGDLKAIGPTSDVYSLGVMLYQLLTGRLPFSGAMTSVLAMILTEEAPPPSALRPDLDKDLEAICLKAMAKRQQARYVSMDELAADLGRHLKGSAAEARSRPPALPRTKPAPAAPAPSQKGDEGLATQMLARLLDQQDKRLAAAEDRSGGSIWVKLFGVCVILAIGAGLVVLAINSSKQHPQNIVNVENKVLVSLDGLKLRDDPAVVIIIDGTAYTREQLAKPIGLKPGDHSMVVKRDDKVIEERKFSTGATDTAVKPFAPEVAAAKTKEPAPFGKVDLPAPKKEEPIPAEPSAAVKPLIAKLVDEDSTVRRQAAESLENLKDRSGVPALQKRVADDIWSGSDGNIEPVCSKTVAVRALRALAPSRATPALVAALKSRTENVRGWACRELGRQKNDKDAVAALAATGLKDTAVAVRVKAADALGESRPPVSPALAAAALAEALFDEDSGVRCHAAHSLELLGDSSAFPAVLEQVVKEAVAALEKRVADDVWSGSDGNIEAVCSKTAAANALRVLAAARATPALVAALKSRTENVRGWACRELGRQKNDKDAVAALAATGLKDTAVAVRMKAADALATSRPPASAALAEALFDEDSGVRCQAAQSLQKLGDSSAPPAVFEQVVKEAVPALEKRVADDVWNGGDGNIDPVCSKTSAANALRALAPDRATPALVAALKSKTENVRAWACRQLGRQKDRESLDALAAATNDPSPKVKKAASEALGQRKK